jgi:hypothetical protein
VLVHLVRHATRPVEPAAGDPGACRQRRPVDSSPYDYSGCAALIDRATLTTRAWIAGGGLDRPCGVPHEMHEHSHA